MQSMTTRLLSRYASNKPYGREPPLPRAYDSVITQPEKNALALTFKEATGQCPNELPETGPHITMATRVNVESMKVACELSWDINTPPPA
eukprot:5818512-Prymnesium_polylepis.2